MEWLESWRPNIDFIAGYLAALLVVRLVGYRPSYFMIAFGVVGLLLYMEWLR